MTSTKTNFAGFNGFGQFKNLSKVVTSFEEIQVESLSKQSKSHIIKCSWNKCACAVGPILYVCGCLNGESNQERHLSFENPIKDVACADNFCLVLLDTGIAYKVDCQTFEICGINATIIQRATFNDAHKCADNFGNSSVPYKGEMNHLPDEYITHIAAGRSLTIAVTNKNNVFNMPLKIHTFPAHVKIKKISCGNDHCLMLTSNGDLYAFGSSSRGQLGLGTLETEEAPVMIEALAGIKIIDMAAGGWHSIAISAFNDLYGWGWNVNGQIGQRLYESYERKLKNGESQIERQKCSTVFASPIIIDLPKDDSHANDENHYNVTENQYHPVAVSAGVRHTIVKTEEGALLGAGWNKYGQLASDKLEDIDQFHVIHENLSSDIGIICGEWSTFTILTS